MGGADAWSVLKGLSTPFTSLPPPVPVAGTRPGFCRGRGFPCASSCTSRFVSGGREEDWGSQLFLGHISCGRGPGSAGEAEAAAAALFPPRVHSFLCSSTLPSPPSSPGLGPAARSCLPQPPSRGPQPPPTPPHGPGAMSELEQLRQEAEQLRNQIRVRAWPAELRVGD